MWLTEGCGGRRRAVATPNRKSRKEKKKIDITNVFSPLTLTIDNDPSLVSMEMEQWLAEIGCWHI